MNNTNYNKIAVLTLGCSKNLVDSERLKAMIEKEGIEVTEDPNNADAIVINTCGFIEASKQESLELILQASEQKHRKNIKKLIVFGCLSERYADSIRKQIPNLDEVLGVNSYEAILKGLGLSYHGDCGRSLLTQPHSAYLKIAEGCNHRCAYCAIPMIRGKFISREMDDIIAEANVLAKSGVKEINLIAQDTTYYGRDIYGKAKLAELMKRVSDIEQFKWIRLLYAYPTDFPIEVAKVIAERDNICNYLDLPLQHIADPVLKSMRRSTTGKKVRNLVAEIKSIVPDIALRTTFIVGYPNETEQDFNDLLRFVEDTRFSRLGVFAYSPEDGTPAFELGDPIHSKVKNSRIDKIMMAQQRISLMHNRQLVGKSIDVMIDSATANTYLGRTTADAPEIDNGVVVKSKVKLSPGDIVRAIVTKADEYDITASYPAE